MRLNSNAVIIQICPHHVNKYLHIKLYSYTNITLKPKIVVTIQYSIENIPYIMV